jgi:hypothetical protein
MSSRRSTSAASPAACFTPNPRTCRGRRCSPARPFDFDVKPCVRAHCVGRLHVRAVVTDDDIGRKILDAIPSTARAPPSVDVTVAYELLFA